MSSEDEMNNLAGGIPEEDEGPPPLLFSQHMYRQGVT